MSSAQPWFWKRWSSSIWYGKEWRKSGYYYWNDESVADLRSSIFKKARKILSTCTDESIRILLIGGEGVGKSSLINTMDAALTGTYTQLACSLHSQGPLTKHYLLYKLYAIENGENVPVFDVCDFRGLDSDREWPTDDVIEKTLLGYLENGTLIKQGAVNMKETEKGQKVQMLAFVVGQTINAESEGLQKRFHRLVDKAAEHDIPTAVFRIRCDEVDAYCKNFHEYLHFSKKVEKAVKMATATTGVNENRVFPIINYKECQHVTAPSAMQCLLPINFLLDDVIRRTQNRKALYSQGTKK